MSKEIGQRVNHKGFGVTGTITDYDSNFEVFVVTLDEPMYRISESAITELRVPAGALEAI